MSKSHKESQVKAREFLLHYSFLQKQFQSLFRLPFFENKNYQSQLTPKFTFIRYLKLFRLIYLKMSDANTLSRTAYRGFCTCYFNEEKTIMEGRSISVDDNNRLSELISLMEKRLTEMQTLDEKIHTSLNVDAIEEAMVLSADLNDQIFINTDTIKRFLERKNRDTEPNNAEPTTSTQIHGTSSSAARNNTRLPKLNLCKI